MSAMLLGLVASIAGAAAWLVLRRVLAIHRARQARLLHGEAGRLRSAILKEIEQLEARHRRLQGSLALADQGGGHARQRQDLRASLSRGAHTELANLRARTEQAYAAASAESGVGLRVRCTSLSTVAREVATWAKALNEREAALGQHARPTNLARPAPARTQLQPQSAGSLTMKKGSAGLDWRA